MGIIQRFKEGCARTVEEEVIVRQKKKVEADGNVFLLMGDPIRGLCNENWWVKGWVRREAKMALRVYNVSLILNVNPQEQERVKHFWQ